MPRLATLSRIAAALIVGIGCSGAANAALFPANVSGIIPFAGTTSFSGTLNYQGQVRNYIAVHPTRASTSGPAPAIFLLHPRDTDIVSMANLALAGRLAANDGAWVFLPEAVDGQWHDDPSPTGSQTDLPDDVGFLSALIDTAVAEDGVDANRIYVAGYSNGGYMAQRIGCELTDKVAGIGVVSAALRVPLAAVCRPTQALSVVLMPGTDDPIIPYNGNASIESAAATVQFWLDNDRCISAPTVTNYAQVAGDTTTVSLSHYTACTAGSEVRVYTIQNGGHTWPGSPFTGQNILGATSKTIDATLELWNTLSSHSLK
jgi:polyhydroxybutyrate depolymerase